MPVDRVRYTIDNDEFEGALVYGDVIEAPTASKALLLMAPNWLGVTEAAIKRAIMLAGSHNVVFVADLYGVDRRPMDFEAAAHLSSPIKNQPQLARRRMHAALEAATREATRRQLWNGRNRAAVGFCFGGGNVLELARSGADVDAVVSIHGDLSTSSPAQPGIIKASVLVIHGTADPVAPIQSVWDFQREMENVGAVWQMHLFGGLLHAYTDRDADVPGVAQFNEAGSRQSYQLMHAFIDEAQQKKG